MLSASNPAYMELFEENLWLKVELEAERCDLNEYMRIFPDVVFFSGRFARVHWNPIVRLQPPSNPSSSSLLSWILKFTTVRSGCQLVDTLSVDHQGWETKDERIIFRWSGGGERATEKVEAFATIRSTMPWLDNEIQEHSGLLVSSNSKYAYRAYPLNRDKSVNQYQLEDTAAHWQPEDHQLGHHPILMIPALCAWAIDNYN